MNLINDKQNITSKSYLFSTRIWYCITIVRTYLLIQLKHDGFGIISELSPNIPFPSTPLTIFRPEKLTNIKKCYPTWALYFILLQSIYILFCLLLLEILTDEKHTAADLLKDSAHKSSRLRLVWMLSQFKIFQFTNSELKTKYIAVL